MSLVFAALFFAGAALTAGADSKPAVPDDAVAPATTDSAPPASAPSTDSGSTAPAPSPAPAAAAPAAPAPAPAPTEVAAPAPSQTPGDAASASAPAQTPTVTVTPSAPATTEATTTPAAASATSAGAAGPTVLTVSPTQAQRPAARRASRASAARKRLRARRTAAIARLESALPARAAFAVVPFDLRAWLNSNPASPLGADAVAIAEHYVGVPYVWGGAAPASGFDCSGLAVYVYAQLGIQLPHYAASQFAQFAKLDPSQLLPGDLVFFEPRVDGPGHVAIYAGGDRIIEAPHTGALVRIGSLSGDAEAMGFLGAVRPYGPAAVAPRQLFIGAETSLSRTLRRSHRVTSVGDPGETDASSDSTIRPV